MRRDNSIAFGEAKEFRALNENVARKENQEECVAPTTARSPGRPPGLRSNGCKQAKSFATNLKVEPVRLTWARTDMQRRNSAG